MGIVHKTSILRYEKQPQTRNSAAHQSGPVRRLATLLDLPSAPFRALPLLHSSRGSCSLPRHQSSRPTVPCAFVTLAAFETDPSAGTWSANHQGRPISETEPKAAGVPDPRRLSSAARMPSLHTRTGSPVGNMPICAGRHGAEYMRKILGSTAGQAYSRGSSCRAGNGVPTRGNSHRRATDWA